MARALARVRGDRVDEDQAAPAPLEPRPVLEDVLGGVRVLPLDLQRHPREVADLGQPTGHPAQAHDLVARELDAEHPAQSLRHLGLREATPFLLRQVALVLTPAVAMTLPLAADCRRAKPMTKRSPG